MSLCVQLIELCSLKVSKSHNHAGGLSHSRKIPLAEDKMEGPTWILGDRAKWPNGQLFKAATRSSCIVHLAQATKVATQGSSLEQTFRGRLVPSQAEWYLDALGLRVGPIIRDSFDRSTR